MNAAQVARESSDVMVVLDRIVVQALNRLPSGGPFLVEGWLSRLISAVKESSDARLPSPDTMLSTSLILGQFTR